MSSTVGVGMRVLPELRSFHRLAEPEPGMEGTPFERMFCPNCDNGVARIVAASTELSTI